MMTRFGEVAIKRERDVLGGFGCSVETPDYFGKEMLQDVLRRKL